LVGEHAAQSCSACHKNSLYQGTPRDCYGCHRADYEGTRDPNHVSAGFPTTCEACHRASDSSWDQARFDHVWFPITTGRHAGNTCSACHPDKSNFQIFSCLTCHSRGDTDDHHRGIAGYNYVSQACYSCHPQGRL
jgi:DnaJ-class molecular chaperone